MKKIVKAVISNNDNSYTNYLKKDINSTAVLLEAGQGKNTNGNMFALLREIEKNEKWKEFTPYFAVNKEVLDEAKIKFEFYGFKRVKCIIRGSKEYKKILATAKYLFTDNTFPTYFIKRKEQIYLNTWHGTPLKTLGKSDIENSASLGNVQKNYFMADYALFPNEYTKDVFLNDYMIKGITTGIFLMIDYPRNEIFKDKRSALDLKKNLGYEKKQLIAYMPTWRGIGRAADVDNQMRTIERYLLELDAQLSDDQIVLVNLHFLVDNILDYSKFKHIRKFPKYYETYDVLNICDMLITDYSSVFFDFAVSGKKIIIFAYDEDEYMQERGTYFSISELPFPIVRDINGLISEINCSQYEDYVEFRDVYCAYSMEDLSEKILDIVINNYNEDVKLYKNIQTEHTIYYVGNISSEKQQQYIENWIGENDKLEKSMIIAFSGRIDNKTGKFLRTLPDNVNFIRLLRPNLIKISDIIFEKLNKKFGLNNKKINNLYRKEFNRLMYNIPPNKVESIVDDGSFYVNLIKNMKS